MPAEHWKDKPQSVRLKNDLVHIARKNVTKQCCTRTTKQITFVVCLYLVLSVLFVTDENKTSFSGHDHEHSSDTVFSRNDEINTDNSDNDTSAKSFVIRALSSREDVFVNVNGVSVYQNGDRTKSSRGIHIVVINELNGKLMSTCYFDTSTRYIKVQQMISYLSNIQNGRIVVFMVKGDGSNQLKKTGRNAIRFFGSHMVRRLGWRDMWALVSKKGVRRYAENLHIATDVNKYGDPVIIETEIAPVDKTGKCDWGNDNVALRRKKFCDAYEGYGNLCSCLHPTNVELNGEPLLGSRLRNVPITIIASNRPDSLYRMLRGLLSTLGVDRKLVTVYIDGYFNEVSSIATLFDVNYTENDPKCNGNCHISQHYRYSLKTTFEKNPQAEYAIIFEDDVDVSGDIMDFFNQMLPLFSVDESVFCVSAWNEHSFDHSVSNPSLAYRVNDFPGYGWVLKKTIFTGELEPKWPSRDSSVDWDTWIRKDIMKSHECVIPEVSRIYHFAAQSSDLSKIRKYNTNMGLKFDREKLTKDGYEKEIKWLIESSKVLDHKNNPCSNEDFIPNTKGEKYVVYIKNDKNDETWLNVASCFRLSSTAPRSSHNKLWRFWSKENMVFVISSDSPYFSYKANDVSPIYIPKMRPTLGTKTTNKEYET